MKEALTEEQRSLYVTNGMLFVWQLTVVSLLTQYFRQKDIATIIIDQVRISRQQTQLSEFLKNQKDPIIITNSVR